VRAVLLSAQSSPKRSECHSRKPSEACVYHVAPARWAVLGDSHAVELAYGMAEELRPLLTGGVYPALPDAVGEDVRRGRREAYRAMLRKLADAGKQVTVVLQARTAEMGRPPGDARRCGRASSRRAGPVVAVPIHLRHDASGRTAPQVRIVDPAAQFCDADRCYAALDGISLYFDDHHMSVEGRGASPEESSRMRTQHSSLGSAPAGLLFCGTSRCPAPLKLRTTLFPFASPPQTCLSRTS